MVTSNGSFDIESFWLRFRLPVALTIVGLTLIGAGVYFSLYQNTKKDIKIITNSAVSSPSGSIVVHLSGAVVTPGVYTLVYGARTGDLIEKAGGFTKDVDQVYIEKVINLASVLKDGSKIYIPRVSDQQSDPEGQVNSANTYISGLININTATVAELETLSGIGEVRAAKIIQNRPYASIEELVSKKVLGEAILEKIKEQITVN